jgi:multicomponent Na+:H+ antiporter subunit D
LREGITLAAAAGKLGLVLSLLAEGLKGKVAESVSLELVPGVALVLKADPLGSLFAVLAAGLWVVTSVYSIGYMRGLGYGHQTGYFASFAVCLSATMGIALANNLLTFFLFYEILTIATYPLVIHRRSPEAIAAGRKYLVYTLAAGQVLLLAIIWVEVLAPGAAFQPGGFLAGRAPDKVLAVIFLLFVVGLGVKAAVMPLHGWLPTAMIAPTPVSALLHAVAVVKAGAFGFVRVAGYVFGPQWLAQVGAGPVLAWAAAVTIVLASLRALAEDNLKRRLAYSTVGQLSYVVLGAGLGTPAALAGAAFHIVAHALMKITLFFCAGAIYVATHRENVSEMDGIGRQMPLTMTAFAVGTLGIVGMPFMVGFISKWYLGMGALEAGQGAFVAVLLVSALLSSGYFFPIVYRAFFRRGENAAIREARAALLVPLLITAVGAVVLGVFPNLGVNFFQLALMVAESVTHTGGGGMAGGP